MECIVEQRPIAAEAATRAPALPLEIFHAGTEIPPVATTAIIVVADTIVLDPVDEGRPYILGLFRYTADGWVDELGLDSRPFVPHFHDAWWWVDEQYFLEAVTAIEAATASPAVAAPSNPFRDHVFIGLDFVPVSESLPDDDSLVMILVAPLDDEPLAMGFREGGLWYFADGVPIGTQATVTHWTDLPEVAQ